MRAYTQARRHSARVRLLRRVIPIGAALAIALVITFAWLNPFGRAGGVSMGPFSLSGTKITMEHPRLTGYRKDTRPYEVTATAALQDVRKPTLIELNEMKARVAMDDSGAMVRLEAATGVFDTQKEQLELRQDVRVRTDSGQSALLKSASIDFKAGTVASREPVTVTLTNGTIDADGLDVTENGKMVSFIGRVHAVFDTVDQGASQNAKSVNAGSTPGPAAPARTSQAEPTSLRP